MLNYLPELKEGTRILDVGCGTGAQTVTLAEHTDAEITAVDMTPEFLIVLEDKLIKKELANRVSVFQKDMEKLDFPKETFDVIWSESAIYIIGFEKGLTEWRKFLKKDGYIVVSDITWLTDERPEEIENFWNESYPEINTIDEKLKVIEKAGYQSIAHFTLPESDWMVHYYNPMRASARSYLREQKYDEAAKQMLDLTENEIKLYEKYRAYYSYVFYIAQKK